MATKTRTTEDIQADMDAVLAAADAEKRTLTDEEVETYEKFEGELKSFQATAQIRKRNDAWKAPRVTFSPANPYGKGEDAERMYAFEKYLRTGRENSDLIQFAGQNEGTPSEGGYLVPTVLQDRMVNVQKAFGGLSAVAAHIETNNGAPINWPSNDDTANLAEQTAESTAIGSGADLVIGTVVLGAYKFSAAGPSGAGLAVSRELAQDARFNVVDMITSRAAIRIARKQALAYEQGTGSSQPFGLFYNTPDINVADSGDALKYGDLVALKHALDPAYRPNAAWIMNDATVATLEKLVDGNQRPLLQPYIGAGISGVIPTSSLLGYPLIVDQQVPDQAPASSKPGAPLDGFIGFGDFNEAFIIRDVAGVEMVVDPYTAASKGQILYYAFARSDSGMNNRKAVAILAGYHS